MEQFVIEVKNVSKSFKGIPVLNDINITCRNGKIYGIIGYNGSGKTVLFKCICGFLHVDSGEISVNGRVMGKEMDMLEHTGIIIEEPGYIRNLSGYRNLEYLYRITHKKDPAVIHSIMLKVGLDPQSRKKVCHYSLGMRQRLAIAQATMEDQAILILDEPMNGLDREGVAEMRKFFLEQKERGKLILLASHNKDDIELLCDEVYEMNHGILAMYSKST